jgi:hypothetical protein
MKKLIVSAALIAMASSGAAYAATINATGNAQQVAHLGTPSGNAAFDANTLINADTALTNNVSKTVTFPNSIVNYAANVGIRSQNGAMTSTNAVAGDGFATKINYIASVAFGAAGTFSTAPTYTTNGLTANVDGKDVSNKGTTGPASGTLSLTVEVPTGGGTSPNPAPISAGDYTDTITVVVGTTA